MLKNMRLKLIRKEQFKKYFVKQLVIWLVIKLIIELQKFQKILNKIIPKQLQIRIIKKYIEKINISPKERQDIIDKLIFK